jgi:hypothetical protein
VEWFVRLGRNTVDFFGEHAQEVDAATGDNERREVAKPPSSSSVRARMLDHTQSRLASGSVGASINDEALNFL